MTTIDTIKIILRDVLQLGDRANGFNESTQLLGDIPEFDSMAVVSLITSIEEHFDLIFEDDDITAESFETLGNLVQLVEEKLEE